MMASKIAAQMYTVRDFCQTPPDIVDTLRKIAKIGYTSVQLSALGPMDPHELRRACDDLGLTICSTHRSFDDLRDQTEEEIELHHIYGCKYPGVGGRSAAYYDGAEGYHRFAQDASAVAAKLAAAGLTFVYHNHSQEFARYGKQTGMDILFEETTADFTFELDTYWVAHGGASPVAWINRTAGRAKVIHFKDMAITEKREQFYCEVGEGNLDWPGILAACEAAQIEWYIVEQDTCEGSPFDALALSFANLKAMGVE
jgi:sugar phosphate isomerase/epimerase